MNISRALGNITNDLLDRFNTSNTASSKPQRQETGMEQTALAHIFGTVDVSGYLQQDVQAEAKELIAKHTHYLGIDLDEEGLGREIAGRVAERPDLARAVYSQLSNDNKVQVARAMIGTLSDDELRSMVWSEDGRGLLHDINRWVANNSLTAEGRSNTEADLHLRERIGVALTRTDDITMVDTSDVERINTYEWSDGTGAETNWTTFGNRSVKVTAEDKQKAREWFDRVNPEWKGKALPKGSEQAKELARAEIIVAQNKYNKIIAEAAREFPGLDPKVLKAFLIQESGLDPKVVNNLGYAGIAQFGANDAREAGLTVKGKVDERLDPEKAIPAAVRFLREKSRRLEEGVYQQYGSPEGEERIKFALAAYNGGEGVVAHAMKAAYGNGLKEAQGKGLTGDAATAYAREYAAKWANLLQPTGDIKSSPLYSATSRYYPKIAESKYREIGAFPTDILARARR